jgi:hypothetical protein
MYYRDAGDRTQEKNIADLLLDRLAHADDIVPRLIVTLGGIANSGYAGALDSVVPHLSDRRAGVRAAGMRALQSIPGEQVDERLASALTSDSDVSVRLAALGSAQIREPSDVMIKALSSAAQAADDANVRYRCVELLAKWGKARQEVRGVIQRVAASDAEERVRALAQSAL